MKVEPKVEPKQEDEDEQARQAALEAERRRKEEEEEVLNSRMNLGGGPFRRQGLPCNVVVDRAGDMFIHMGRLAATQAIEELLDLRVPILRRMHASVHETPLNKEDTKAVLRQLFASWSSSAGAKHWCDEAWR